MNAKQKEVVNEIISRAEEIAQNLEDLESEEQEAFDTLPGKSQQGRAGEKINSSIDTLQETKKYLGHAILLLGKLAKD